MKICDIFICIKDIKFNEKIIIKVGEKIELLCYIESPQKKSSWLFNYKKRNTKFCFTLSGYKHRYYIKHVSSKYIRKYKLNKIFKLNSN